MAESKNDLNLRWLGVAGLVIGYDGKVIVQDPYLSHQNYKDVKKEYEFWKQKKIDEVLLTHGHFDHSKDISEVLNRYNARTFMNADVSKRRDLIKHQDKIVGLDKESSEYEISPKIKLTALRNAHVKYDLPLVSETFGKILKNKTLLSKEFYQNVFLYPSKTPYVYNLNLDNKFNLVTLGSLALNQRNKDLLKEKGIDLLCLPVQGRSDIIEQAEALVTDMRPKGVYLYHWDDFYPPLSKHVDISRLVENLKKKDFIEKVYVPRLGKNIRVEVPQKRHSRKMEGSLR
ncbi:MAG: MBL fold metallo-hydrolase [Candidatus Pacearchaeota archaeon]|jgi:L-ascorbate metabolism protein UlaG (beta-lactamase superfamily)